VEWQYTDGILSPEKLTVGTALGSEAATYISASSEDQVQVTAVTLMDQAGIIHCPRHDSGSVATWCIHCDGYVLSVSSKETATIMNLGAIDRLSDGWLALHSFYQSRHENQRSKLVATAPPTQSFGSVAITWKTTPILSSPLRLVSLASELGARYQRDGSEGHEPPLTANMMEGKSLHEACKTANIQNRSLRPNVPDSWAVIGLRKVVHGRGSAVRWRC
jgi:hypothetical protein